MLTWAELETAAPDLTARGRELLERFQFVFVGTLTKDGAPRVNPCEAYVIDGHLLLNMMPRSLKALDLLRDPASTSTLRSRRRRQAKAASSSSPVARPYWRTWGFAASSTTFSGR